MQTSGASQNHATKIQVPTPALPKGGGAIRSIGEKFAANPVTGTGAFTVPVPVSASRFGPQLTLAYDSGAGNGPFGTGWTLGLAAIARKTDKGRPQYRDADESDVFQLSNVEDLVPTLKSDGTFDEAQRDGYTVRQYRPRIEGLFARVERWTRVDDGDTYWRSISPENITTLYGKDSRSRIADPADPSRIFSWLICESYDDKGNAILYEHVPEDSVGVDATQAHERHRPELARSANRYLKRIKYGNRIPNRDANGMATDPEAISEWMFEVLFDYGEGHYEPLPDDAEHRSFARASLETPAGAWPVRQDPFSSYRAGFEVRTYRVCHRVLMVHHFAQDLPTPNYLVGSLELTYQENPTLSFVTGITQAGYVHSPLPAQLDRYLRKPLPTLDLEYSQVPTPEQLAELPVYDIDADSAENLPFGADGITYRWIDLDGDGLAGILTEQADGWFYKRNVSAANEVEGDGVTRTAARFAALELVSPRPAADLGVGTELMDLAGDGQVDLVVMNPELRGLYERTADRGWASFRAFSSSANVNMRDPNLRFVDLDGDGHADVVVTEGDVLTWYPSLGEAGFGPGQTVRLPHDEENGARIVFADGTESLYVADVSGDGRTDLVRIRNGEVCYWPWLGERFGKQVVMDGSPLFDRPERFDPRRLRLADIDGSGTTDIIYLSADRIDVYRNQSGNSWSAAAPLHTYPATDNVSSVQVVDLLGTGTACLVWSSPLPANASRPMRYIDLMRGQKPHLLTRTTNNQGASTVVTYASSTTFCLQDRLSGTPWITRLPFPVHVVERVETHDLVNGNRLVRRFAYHDGHFDGDEREFRGFGVVDQWDTEEALTDASELVPPMLTKTWFHTGIHDEQHRITGLPLGLTPDEEREASRALKGSMLRQEVYGLDGSSRASHPYTVVEQAFAIEVLQPRGSNRHAVFFTHERETRTYHYERDLDRPRIGHALTLDVDRYGNVLKSVSIAYGRSGSELPDARDRQRQTRTLISYTDNAVTNAIDEPDAHRTPRPADVRTYELHADPQSGGYTPSGADGFFTAGDFVAPINGQLTLIESGAGEIAYEEALTADKTRRLLERIRTRHRRNDLTGMLGPGELESLALPGATARLAFTPGLLEKTFLRTLPPADPESLLPNPALVLGGTGGSEGGYVDLDGDGHWWAPSGATFFATAVDIANPAQTAAAELAEARQHFFLPRLFVDPFDQASTVGYDAYDLLVARSEDAVHNVVTAVHDYRVLQPREITDANGNRSAAMFDALGLVAGTVVMGKAAGPIEGDAFDVFTADLSPQQIADFFDAVDPRPLAVAHLGTATTRLVYALDRVPVCAASIARKTHVSDLVDAEQTEVTLSFVYADGFGRQAQSKVDAEPGPLDPNDATADVADPRWVSTGATIYNNKGKPVRTYEPFFSQTHAYGIEQHGVSQTLFYDPADRLVATLHPDHTWDKVVFDAWQQTTYDTNDTVLNADGATDPSDDPDVGGFFARLPNDRYLPTWYVQRVALPASDPLRIAADKAFIHRQTPSTAHLDPLGRPFLTVTRNRFLQDAQAVETQHASRVDLDIEGNQRELRDAVVHNGDATGRVVMRYDYDLLGTRIHQASMEAGEEWLLHDVAGKRLRGWDSRGHDSTTEYDAMRRLVAQRVRGTDAARSDPRTLHVDVLFERIEYGEGQQDDTASNLRGRVFRTSDRAGTITATYDFTGNAARSTRQLTRDYKALPNWLTDVPLDGPLDTRTTFDALNRPLTTTLPDQSVVRASFKRANLLETLDVHMRGAANATPLVANIEYSARGQRTMVAYANGATTRCVHDEHTFRLVRLLTTRPAAPNDEASPIFATPNTIQDIRYVYDPAGNITRIADAALATVFHGNAQIDPIHDYTYDALYRLIEATGREHIGQTTLGASGTGTFRDYPFVGLGAHPNDWLALRNYVERYEYDAAGNCLGWTHLAAQAQWTRTYAYDAASLLESTTRSNRLTSTAIGATSDAYTYDAHGNLSSTPHLTAMQWSFTNHLQVSSAQAVSAGSPESTFYVYDAAGQRLRKVTERQNGTRKSEHVYLGAFETIREFAADGETVMGHREIVHVMDGQQRVALIESTIVDGGQTLDTPVVRQRYQFSNHLGSASVELNELAEWISYEEYHPYGTTAFQAVSGGAANPKRHRYSGKERDVDTGFYYFGARYYAPWLGRWISPDPALFVDSLNLYLYCADNPIGRHDARGLQSCDPQLASCDPEAEPEPLVNSLDPEDPRNHVNPLSVIDKEAVRQAFRESLGLQHDARATPDVEDPSFITHITEAALANDAVKGQMQIEQERREERERAKRDPIAEANGAGDKLGEPGKILIEVLATQAGIKYGAQLLRAMALQAELYAASRGLYSVDAAAASAIQWGARTMGPGVEVSGTARSLGSAWALDELGMAGRFSRGNAFDMSYFGNNLGQFFPTIDVAARLDRLPASPLIRSSKSLNANLESYARPGSVYDRVMKDADKLGDFTSATHRGLTVTATQDTTRILQVAVPGRISAQASEELMRATIDAAAMYGVRLDIVKIY